MDEHKILDGIKSPEDLRALPDSDMDALAEELRQTIIEQVNLSGGHLASNLGVVELTLALHRVFDTPEDTLIWDVGHQCYAHKLLTGRQENFSSLRTVGGMSGFPVRGESEYDPFGAGHSSTSISAALGFAEAARMDGSGRYTVAVLGDGAFTGGLVHEALNNIDKRLRLVIVLNDNKMSISNNTGRFSKHLADIRSSARYHKTKKVTRSFIMRIPLIGVGLFKAIRWIKKVFKNLFFSSNYFEDIGLYYLGPVDGHDYEKLHNVLLAAKDYNGTCIVHVKTTKGKGYTPAENDPEIYHGVSPCGAWEGNKNFSSKIGELLTERAETDKDICVITAAMMYGCGVAGFAAKYPERFFDVGIAEEHALVFAAGLAAAGKKPVFTVYSTFLQRGYDNIIHDIALQNLAVTVGIDRAGIAATDGPTHNGIFDVAMLCELPNVSLYAPIDFTSLEDALDRSLAEESPSFIRYPNNCEDLSLTSGMTKQGDIRVSFDSASDCDCFVITYGYILCEARKAADMLEKDGIKCGLLLLEKLLPLEEPAQAILDALSDAKSDSPVIFLEEGVKNGGLGECIYEVLRHEPVFDGRKYEIKAIDEPFARLKEKRSVMEFYGISADRVYKEMKTLIEQE